MSETWPREIADHLIDRETSVQVGRGAEVQEQFVCVDCGRSFEEPPDPDDLRGEPCDPRRPGDDQFR